MIKSKIIITAISFLLWLAEVKAQTLLQAYIDTALKNNPSLRVYNYQSDAMQQKIKQSKALDDPMLYGGVMNLPANFNFRQEEMTMKQIGIQQNFSVAKKYSLKGNIAKKDFEASQYDLLAQQFILIKQVKQQYYDLYSQTKAIETTQSSIDAMKVYIDIANTRYGTGQGTQQDILKAQVELTKMMNELIKMQSMREDVIAIFNTLLNRNKADSVVIPAEIKFKKVDLIMDSIMNEAAQNNPELLSSKKILSKDSVSYELAKTSKIPDFNTGFWYGKRQALLPDGSKAGDMLGFMISINLPLYYKRKQNSLIAESNINIQKTESQIKAMQNEIQLMLHHAKIDANKNEKLISLFEKQLIPQATASLNSGIIGYQQNKIDFMTLTDNFLSLYNYRLQYYQLIADYYKAIAELEMLTGKTLNAQ
ncbi:MAG: TolC family protein [Bacteroidetes bacterium]|nr:TolC family protein [Bacteroidota bacterium]